MDDYPERMSEQFSGKVRRTAQHIRRIADAVERRAEVGHDLRTMELDHARAASEVVHEVMWGLANADLDGLVQRARDADDARHVAAEAAER